MVRFLVNENDYSDACEYLDEAGIPYDFDSGDRIMIEEEFAKEATEVWDSYGIDYDEI